MCSWCWGITGHLERLVSEFGEKLELEIVLGGLRPGGGDPWDDKTKAMLKHHWDQVHEASGQPFNYDLLSTDVFNYDTEPPSRAVRIVRDLNPKEEFDFFKEVQRKFYVENKNPGNVDFYESICRERKVDFEEFTSCFESTDYRQAVAQDFIRSASFGVRGFPTVLLQKDDDLQAVALGYASLETMRTRLNSLID